MSSLSESDRRGILLDLHRSLTLWIPKRKATISSMEEILDEIATTSKDANIAKVVGSSVGIASGVVGGILGVAAIVATGGLGTPFVVAGVAAGVAGVGGAITTGGAEIAKAVKLPKLLGSAQEKMDEEVDEYKTVIHNLGRLHVELTEKTKVSIPTHTMDKVSAGVNAMNAAVNLLAAYSFMCVHIAELASVAAAEAAAVAATKSTCFGLIGPSAKTVTMAATKAAKKAATSTAVGALLKGISKSTSKAIARAAGKAAGEAAIEAVGKCATKEGAKALAKAAARPAARAAGRAILKGSVKAAGEFTGKTAAKAAGKATGITAKTTGKSAGAAIGKAIGKSLPLLNFGFAAWDTYECVQGGIELANGCEEEKILKDKMQQLKEEANKIVKDIYNYFASEETMKLTLLEIPFPECKT